MDIYIARQPIFDRKMDVYGYELLYRKSMNNFYEGKDDNQATSELINNAFFSMKFNELTSGTRAFINFSEEILLKEIPFLLPKEGIVVEILERVEITDKVIEACKKLKKKGYIIALDDFVFNETYKPLIEVVDIIKIEFPVIDYETQKRLIKEYKNKVKFLAEKVETREEYAIALDMGYDYFQGYFFSKPVIIKGKDVDVLNTNLIRIISELNREEPEYQTIVNIIEMDIGLSYKILKAANSVLFGSRNKINSIKQALIRIGIVEMKKWVYIMMFKEIQDTENKELIKTSLIRGKLMELLAPEIGMRNHYLELFTAGLFSSIDVLLNREMADILKELPFGKELKEALLGGDNELSKVLNMVLNYETFNWAEIESEKLFVNITEEKFMALYIEALKGVMKIGD